MNKCCGEMPSSRHVIFKFFGIFLMMVFSGTLFAQIIYGLDKACTFQSRHQGTFTIQAGAFANKASAHRLKSRLASNHHPVKVLRSHQYYVVSVGPFHSVAEVNKVGCAFNKSPILITKSKMQGPIPSSPAPAPIFIEKDSALKVSAPGNWYVGADIGAAWSTMSNSLSANNGSDFPPPENVDYFSTSSANAQPILGVSAGYRWVRDMQTLPAYSLGARYQHLFTQPINGTVMQYSLPQFTNYSYSWGVDTNVISLYSKIDLINYGKLMPYIDVGIGASFNQSSTYQETAFAGIDARDNPAFAKQTSTQFVYNVGAGLDYQLTPQVIVGLGYDYQSYGRVSSGPGQTTWSSSSLNLGNFSTNTVLLSGTYLLDGPK